ncbi:MAG TPA: transglycosylase SLT domain-containing protein, partial [Myxococcota bacterium]|nr:transglycosylase SLT domain-containing protein [Myxococcota bacterium]
GRFLKPAVTLANPEALLDPALNARLGGALVGSGVRRFAGNLGLALAGYNAGEDVALAWWKKFAGQEFAVFAEEMTIQETRGYVQRVLRTYGIYRWLYAGALPVLPVAEALPPRPGAATSG